METIIIKPKSVQESEQVLRILEQMNIEVEIYREHTKEEILGAIERGAQDVVRHLKGEINLKDARQLLNEL